MPPAEDELQERPVTPRVNSSRYQEADAVLPLPMGQMQDQTGI